MVTTCLPFSNTMRLKMSCNSSTPTSVDSTEPITRARVKLGMYPWSRLNNPHAFVRDGRYVRTATVTYDGSATRVVSGVKDLVLLKTTDSEFWGYLQDRYTTLQPTNDRVMATSLLAQWRREHLGQGRVVAWLSAQRSDDVTRTMVALYASR